MGRKDKSDQIIQSEWHYPIEISEIETKKTLYLEAGREQLSAIARRLQIVEIKMLGADITIIPDNMTYHVKGNFTARVVQNCVVTQEPTEEKLSAPIEAWFADSKQAVSLAKARRDKLYGKNGHEMPILEEKEDPEPLQEEKIDLGELVIQFLSLNINPYPHAQGATIEEAYPKYAQNKEEQETDLKKNPFAKLKDWKKNLKEQT